MTPLREILRGHRFDLESLLDLAVRITDLLGDLHRRQLIHGMVSPDSVMVDPDRRSVAFADAPTAGVGSSLASRYSSPEQTGRMNRAIDYRTDFYSLGVTLYELLTGDVPFMSDDALELLHAHIARSPVPPSEVDAGVPDQVSRIVLRLLAKAAEERYQTAHGLRQDLDRCRQAWATGRSIPSFELGQQDVPDRFLIPQRLYGRDRDVAALMAAFEATGEGRSALTLVCGYSGIGKTALIQELYKPIVRERGYFVAGKCDQIVRNIPYGALAQALGSLVRQILTESEDRLDGWRSRISAALGSNGGLLAEVIPEIELIIGRQAPPPALDPTEARNRFGYVFQRFVGALARKEHPLVIFLDDLQWVDGATLDVLHEVLANSEIQHLLVIGAYRDNEVDDAHLLTWAIRRLEAAGGRLSRLALGPLELPDLVRFLADTFHRDRLYIEPLARLIQAKTDGNPFFVIQFLAALEQDRLLTFDPERAGWSYALDAVAAAGLTDNVVDLMTRKILRLSPGARHVLTMAACIGNPFEWDTFRVISRQSPGDAEAGLAEALQAGLVQPVMGPSARPPDQSPAAQGAYRFLHDRVQQAAYGLIPEADRAPLHLDVGRLLLAGQALDVPDERIFPVVHHLNLGRDLIDHAEERQAIARLNLAAGRKAKASAAYQAALEYFRRGAALIGPNGWAEHHDLVLALHLEAAECEYLSGGFAAAEHSFRLLLDHATRPLDRAQIYALQITVYENQSRWTDAVAAGRNALRLFGIVFPDGKVDTLAALDHEMRAVQESVGVRAVTSLVDLPEMSDPDMRMVLRILTILWAPAYISGDELLARLISATMVHLSLAHGHTEDSAYGYVTHAITVGPVRKQYRDAYEWGRLALAVNRRFNDVKRRAKIHQQFQAHVNLWCRPFATCLPHAAEATRAGLEAGDFLYAGYGAATEAWSAFVISRDLDAFVRDFTPTLALLDQVKMADFRDAHHILLNWARALAGRGISRASLSDATFDEERFVAAHQGEAAFFLTFIHAARLHLGLIFDDAPAALAAARQARAVAVGGTIWPVLIDYWSGLAAARASDEAPESERGALRETLEAASRTIEELAAACPENFRCMALLLSSEGRRLDGDVAGAAALLEDAIAFAHDTANLQQEALANELSARLWLHRRDAVRARRFVNEAYRAYAEWGAAAKLTQLEERYGPLLTARPAGAGPARSASPSAPTPTVSVDMSTVTKVAQAIAREMEVGGLLRRLMQLALENAGAQRGMFVHARDGGLAVQAEASSDRTDVTVGQQTPLDRADALAVSVVRYVHRTGQAVVIDDAARDERFAADAAITRSPLKSVLCVPVAHQGRLGGVLHLENNLTTHAFTPERIEVMRILAAQAAISLENARLYEHATAEVERRTAAEQALRDALGEVEALKNRLEAENVYLKEEIRTQHNFDEIIGNSPALLDALRKVERVAPVDSTVLIVGETGSGKELFARAVHHRSRRADRPLVKVNCGAIAPGLVESELFGHVKGAFTGAIDRRVGRFELADGGTIFLDEIGELPLDAQVKLLRVLQEQEFEPVGSSRTVRVSVRVIAATNRDLEHAVRDGRFRADLLYRLNVFPIDVPPLRERKGDVELLVKFFAAGLSRRLGKPIHGFSARSIERLATYSWPGNVRELQNAVERAAILAPGPILELESTVLPDPAAIGMNQHQSTDRLPADSAARSLQDIERRHIIEVLRSTGGTVEGERGAALILGLHPNTLRSRMKKLGIAASRRHDIS